MDLKLPITIRDGVEYTLFGSGVAYSTVMATTDYFLLDFPIEQVNQYVYTLVMLITIAIGAKRMWGWRKKKSNDNDKSE